MCEKSLEKNNKVYVCCVDFEKTFDICSLIVSNYLGQANGNVGRS